MSLLKQYDQTQNGGGYLLRSSGGTLLRSSGGYFIRSSGSCLSGISTLFLIALGISAKVNAQDLLVTNNTSCAIDVTFSSVDQVTCTISSAGPTTVNPSTTVTLTGPLPNGVVYKAQGKVGSSACSVIDCSTNYTGCNPPSPCGGSSNTGTIPTTSCGTPAPYMTITAAPSGSNGTLVIN